MENNPVIIFCTTPDHKTADEIASSLVQDKLAACCNVINGILSVYRWDGSIQKAEECLLIIKSIKSRYKDIELKIKSIHPYEVPEIIATDIQHGSGPYLKWITESTG